MSKKQVESIFPAIPVRWRYPSASFGSPNPIEMTMSVIASSPKLPTSVSRVAGQILRATLEAIQPGRPTPVGSTTCDVAFELSMVRADTARRLPL